MHYKLVMLCWILISILQMVCRIPKQDYKTRILIKYTNQEYKPRNGLILSTFFKIKFTLQSDSKYNLVGKF